MTVQAVVVVLVMFFEMTGTLQTVVTGVDCLMMDM